MNQRYMWGVVALSCLGFMNACQKAPTNHNLTWSSKQGAQPAVFQSAEFHTADRSVLVLGDVVRYAEQKWGPAAVEGGSLQTIENVEGEAKYGTAHYRVSPDVKQAFATADLEKLDLNKNQFTEKLKGMHPWLRTSKFMSEPELVIMTNGKPKLAYRFDLLQKDSSGVERVWVSPGYVIMKREPVSLNFDSEASVFTLENKGVLQEVLFQGLMDAPILESRTHRVTSQSPLSLPAVKDHLAYPIDDPRFDQLQAFYFVEKALEFFTTQLNFTIPYAINVETSVGYPQNTSAAFTYQNQIRLGHGDGEVYGPLARDPSIVIHEVAHVLNDVVAHLPTQGEGGSLNEAFADFFAASYLNSPLMAQGTYLKGPYKRSLEDVIRYSEKNGGLYHDSQIVSGTLWELRSKMGSVLTQKLALKTLAHLGPANSLDEFPKALEAAAAEMLTPEQTQLIKAVLMERQWPG